MSCIQYLHPSCVYNITPFQLTQILCRHCHLVPFNPLMCPCCSLLSCSFHPRNCPKTSTPLSDHISPQYTSILMNLKIRCPCSKSFSYPSYLAHKSKCQTHKFKSFEMVLKDGSTIKINEVYNASINANLIDKRYHFVLNSYRFNLETMKCSVEKYSYVNKGGEEEEEFGLKFKEEPPKKAVYWFREEENNMYKPYDEKDQRQIEESYGYYLDKRQEMQEKGYEGGNLLGINFATFLAHEKHRVHRKTFNQQKK